MKKRYDVRLVSYLTVRSAIGLLGIIFPLVLAANSYFCGRPLEESISDYYSTNLGDVFVGILTAIAMFLFSYRGYEKELDNVLTNVAAGAALLVAFFPCNETLTSCVVCKERGFSGAFNSAVHNIGATIFFLSLSVLLIFYFAKSDHVLKNRIYRVCGVIMLLCVAYCYVALKVLGDNRIFIPESLALFAFGFAWMVKGKLILPGVKS